MVEHKSIYHDAEERIGARHPKPKFEPFSAGITGLMAAVAAAVTFSAFAGMDAEAFPVALIETAALGFIAPYLYFRQAHKEYWMKVISEHRTLEERKKANAERP